MLQKSMKPFYDRLRSYFEEVGRALRGEAAIASVFPNIADVGSTRERVYGEFLKSHLPIGCAVQYGGFLFGLSGDESGQLDIMVIAGTCPQFSFLSRDGSDKTFACVDGTLAVVSVKSTLGVRELREALTNIASLPQKTSIEGRVFPLLTVPSYEDWPFKVIYASKGLELEEATRIIDEFYREHIYIPLERRPNLIHVGGKYVVLKIGKEGGQTRDGTRIPPGYFYTMRETTDVYGLIYCIKHVQQHCIAANHIIWNYDALLDKIDFASTQRPAFQRPALG